MLWLYITIISSALFIALVQIVISRILFRKLSKKLDEFQKTFRQVQQNLFEHVDTPANDAHEDKKG